jgi:hypothetical protein
MTRIRNGTYFIQFSNAKVNQFEDFLVRYGVQLTMLQYPDGNSSHGIHGSAGECYEFAGGQQRRMTAE